MAVQIDATGIETVNFDGNTVRFSVADDGALLVTIDSIIPTSAEVHPYDAARIARWLGREFGG